MTELFDAAFLRELESLNDALLRLRGKAGEGISRKGRSSGQSEFRGHRPYSVGDDVRRLDWNAYGRLGKLFVREFERERQEHVTVLLDCSRSMAVNNKHVFARRVAAALGFLALKSEGSATLLPDAVVEGISRFSKWLDTLRGKPADDARHFADRVREAAARPRAPSDLVVISDFLEPLETLEPLRSLSERRCAITLVQVLAQEELSPKTRGSYDLHGIEEAKQLRLDLDASRLEAYRAELEAHLEALESLAARHGWTYALAPADSELRALFTEKLLAVGGAA